jgi:predicted component of type VI protein secretion system
MRRAGVAAAAAALLVVLTGCGGGGTAATTTATPVTNTLPLLVDLGPNLNGQTVGFDNSL